MDKLLFWKIKRQPVLTQPIYYRVAAAGEPSKPNRSPNGGEGSVTKLLGCRRTWAGEGGWWQPGQDSPVPAAWGSMSPLRPRCRMCHLRQQNNGGFGI